MLAEFAQEVFESMVVKEEMYMVDPDYLKNV